MPSTAPGAMEVLARVGLDPASLTCALVSDSHMFHVSASCPRFAGPLSEFTSLASVLASDLRSCPRCQPWVVSEDVAPSDLRAFLARLPRALDAADQLVSASSRLVALDAAFTWVEEVLRLGERSPLGSLEGDALAPLRDRMGEFFTLPLRLSDMQVRVLMAVLSLWPTPLDLESKKFLVLSLLERQGSPLVVMGPLVASWERFIQESSSFSDIGERYSSWASSPNVRNFLAFMLGHLSGFYDYGGYSDDTLLSFWVRALLHERRGRKVAFFTDPVFAAFHHHACFTFSVTSEDTASSVEVLDRLARDATPSDEAAAFELIEIARKL